MSEVRIAAEPRTEFGKGAARRVRRAHKVPAVLYGHGDAPRHYSLPGHELMLALKHDANALLTLQTEDGDQLALPKAVVRDPLKGFLEHVDLVAVRRGERVTVEVPLVVSGDVAPGAMLGQEHTTVQVEAEATHLPNEIEVSVEGLDVGAHVTAGDLKLPAGATLVTTTETLLLNVMAAPTAEEIEADTAGAIAELGIVEEPAETATGDESATAGDTADQASADQATADEATADQA